MPKKKQFVLTAQSENKLWSTFVCWKHDYSERKWSFKTADIFTMAKDLCD